MDLNSLSSLKPYRSILQELGIKILSISISINIKTSENLFCCVLRQTILAFVKNLLVKVDSIKLTCELAIICFLSFHTVQVVVALSISHSSKPILLFFIAAYFRSREGESVSIINNSNYSVQFYLPVSVQIDSTPL